MRQKFVNCSILITKGLERGVLMKAIEHKRIILPKMPTIDTEGRVGFMYNSAELEKCRNSDFCHCEKDRLTDISDIEIDTEKSVVERMENYFASVSNPYMFRVGDVGVKVNCLGEKSLNDALTEIVNLQ